MEELIINVLISLIIFAFGVRFGVYITHKTIKKIKKQ